jgi:methylmalonyl-CoA/ethylmalonyl-CoA epimerase
LEKVNHKIAPSHVAVLVPSVERAAMYLKKLDFQIGAVDEFEETREIYVQYGRSNPLLLMEPKGTGSYQRALDKRGPGIHHLAIDVLDLNQYLKSIKGSGWLLHLNSIDSIKDYKTAYLRKRTS